MRNVGQDWAQRAALTLLGTMLLAGSVGSAAPFGFALEAAFRFGPLPGALSVSPLLAGGLQVRSLFPSDEDARNSGPGHPWQGGPSNVNPFSFAKQTEVPIISWTARGGLPVSFSLHHSSQGFLTNPTLGPKWLHSGDATLLINTKTIPQRAAIVWGDHRIQMFAKSGAAWISSDGYRDTLAPNGSGFRLTLKHQTRIEFEPAPGSLTLVKKYRLASMVDPNGNTLTHQYDGLGRLSTITDPSSRSVSLAYVGGRLDSVTFSVGAFSRAWHLFYDGSGRLIRVDWPSVTTDTGPQVYSTQFEYTATGNNVSRVVDSGGFAWSYFYNGNRLASEQWPLNAANERVLYGFVSPSLRLITDPRGIATNYEYDSLSRLVRVQDPNGNNTMFEFTDPDYQWCVSRMTRPSGDQFDWDWQVDGNLTRYTSPWGASWDYTYDSRNNLLSAMEPLVTDAFGVTEPGRHRTEYVYDANSNLITVKRFDSPGTFFSSWYGYNGFGEVINSTNANGKITQYQYDAFGNLTRVETPTHRVVQWLYSTAGSTFGFTRPQGYIDGLSQQININRDEWGRTRVLDLPTGTDPQYSYDGMNRLVKIVDATGTTNRAFNGNGWLHNMAVNILLVEFSYLPNGLRSQSVLTTLYGSNTKNYTYDSRNLLSGLSDGGPFTSFQYDGDARLVRRNLANGASKTFLYSNGRCVAINNFDIDPIILQSSNYSFQENGLVKSITDEDGGITKTRYDFLNRLTREVRTVSDAYALEWTYDPVGNRVSQIHYSPDWTHSYTYDDDDLLLTDSVQGQQTDQYAWNANEQLTDRIRQNGAERFKFTYDFQGHLTGMTRWNGSIYQPFANYVYDGLGRRVHRDRYVAGVLDTTNDYFLLPYLEADNFAGEHKVVQGVPTDTFMNWAGGLLNTHEPAGANARWSATDDFGDMRASTNGAGHDVGFKAIYNRFGEVMASQGTSSVYGFGADAGMRTEGDAGFIFYNGHAGLGANIGSVGSGSGFYDPKVGRSNATDCLDLGIVSSQNGVSRQDPHIINNRGANTWGILIGFDSPNNAISYLLKPSRLPDGSTLWRPDRLPDGSTLLGPDRLPDGSTLLRPDRLPDGSTLLRPGRLPDGSTLVIMAEGNVLARHFLLSQDDYYR